MKSLHILHSEAATGWGGQEIRVFQESQLLLERGHRVSIVCRPYTPLADRCVRLNHPNFKHYLIAMERSLDLFAFIKLLRIIKRIQPDILHTHSSIDSWLVSFCGKLLGVPIVRSRHVSIPVKNYFPKNWVYSFPERIITSGEAIETLMRQLDSVSGNNVVSVNAGVDLRRFDCHISGASIRQELGIQNGQPLIGKIAVIRGWKGHDILLETVPLVLAEFPDAKFVIVGDGPGYQEILRKVSLKGLEPAVTLLGHREDIPEIMAALDVQVQASTAGEGTPQVIPQAFAMKTPVVGTQTGSIPDILGNGDRGVLVKPGDSKQLADGIIKVLQEPKTAQSLVENAFKYCQEELAVEKMMDKTIAVYEDILTGLHED